MYSVSLLEGTVNAGTVRIEMSFEWRDNWYSCNQDDYFTRLLDDDRAFHVELQNSCAVSPSEFLGNYDVYSHY
jgi:hypothetical protein